MGILSEIHVISDTHSQHGKIKMPGGQALFHTGDMTARGGMNEIFNALDWLAEQEYDFKVVIPGNHDFGFERDYEFWHKKFAERDIFLLNDSGVEIEGIKIWGSPITPWFHSWAFNRYRGTQIKTHWDLIPPDTEILLTHGPPEGILDMCQFPDGTDREGVGCEELLTKIIATPSIKLHAFGHIHEAKGIAYKYGKTFVNASSLDSMYAPIKDTPVVIRRTPEGIYIAGEQSLD